MSLQTVLLPLFAQVALTLALMILMAARRAHAIRNKQVRAAEVSLREPNWPPRALQAAYAYGNQFELPVLFYVLTILVVITQKADLVFVVLAWIFVALRVLQAWVYVTNNNIRYRGLYFAAGAVTLTSMWVSFARHFLLA